MADAPLRTPRGGDLVYVDRSASVQFAGQAAIYFRVIRAHDWPTYEGWCWLDGYEVDKDGKATDRRSIFVQLAGLRRPSTR